MKEWCAFITNMVDDSERKLVEEVMSSAQPAMLKFVKNGSIFELTEIGFLTEISPGSPSSIKEVFNFCLISVSGLYVLL